MQHYSKQSILGFSGERRREIIALDVRQCTIRHRLAIRLAVDLVAFEITTEKFKIEESKTEESKTREFKTGEFKTEESRPCAHLSRVFAYPD